MKTARKALAFVLTLVLLLAFGVISVAQADTGVKSAHGGFAAEALERIYMILPTDNGSSLYSMPELGGTVTLIETAPQINDLIADDQGNLYYLRYTGAVFQAAVRRADGTSATLASFEAGQIAYSLSFYDNTLYCLVDKKLTRIDMDGTGVQTISDSKMGSYTISDGIVYYQSDENEISYEKAYTRSDGTQMNVTTASGKMFAMNIDGSSNMQQFDQGVSDLAAYGEYVYFHNYNDNYVVDGNPDAWLDGKLYRLNVQTNQFKLLREGYDWSYRPVDLGLVIYQSQSLTIAAQDGTDPVLLYEPDPYNYIVLLDDCAIIYEYNLQKLTRVPYDQSGAVQLWSGAFVTDGSTGEVFNESQQTQTTQQTTSNTSADTTVTGNTNTDNTDTSTNTNTGTSSSSSSSQTTGVTANGSLTYGATGEKVREIQEKLKELGYLSYVDGVFGKDTLQAVKLFQRAAGLTVDGVAGQKTIDALNASNAPKYDGSSTTATDSSYIFPNSSTQKLTRSEILAIDQSLWPYARNEIYARHGYSFQQSKYRDYFEKKTWYKEGGFSTKDLNSIEWYNMELLADMEKEYEGKETSSSTSSSTNSSSTASSSTSETPDYEQEYIFPNSSTQKLTKEEIRAVDKELWPYARNEIYARHGYKFTKTNFKNYFESKSWYKAGGFSTKDLNDIEWYNMELIRWMEQNET